LGGGEEPGLDDKLSRYGLVGSPADGKCSTVDPLTHGRTARAAKTLSHFGSQPILKKAVANPNPV
jgi:hypothetical protein